MLIPSTVVTKFASGKLLRTEKTFLKYSEVEVNISPIDGVDVNIPTVYDLIFRISRK